MPATLFSFGHFASTLLRRGVMVTGITCLLVACGGGSSDSGNDSNTTLLINAGADATVTEGITYNLNAEVSGGDGTYTFSWSASPSLTITHEDTSVSAASFTAPTVDTETQHTLTVLVNDQSGNTATDEAIITVSPVNFAPQASIEVPQWDGLAENRFPGGVEVVLDGSGSADPEADSTDTQNGIAEFSWSQLSGTNVVTGAVTSASTLTFTTPIMNESQTLSFQLEVSDTEGSTDTEAVTISVQSASETVPVVEAGFSQGVFSGEVIILSGEASTSVPDALPLTYSWESSSSALSSRGDTLVSVTSDEIDDTEALSTFAIAPQVTTSSVLTYTLSVTDANGNLVEDSISVRVLPMPTPLLNDTGFLQQATNDAITQAQQNDFPGQDGQRGADIIEDSGLIEKAGRGKAGFDFTRLNANGDEQDSSATSWSCVRDNVTGLVWEVKTDDGTFQDKDYTYSWFSDDVNGGFDGDETGANATCLLTNCNTSAYIDAINTQGLCGFYDWRLPTHHELFTLMHLGIADDVAIDEDYFPNTGAVSSAFLWYWTSVPSADGVGNDDAQNAWALDFDSGVDNFLNKSTAARVRLVRAGR